MLGAAQGLDRLSMQEELANSLGWGACRGRFLGMGGAPGLNRLSMQGELADSLGWGVHRDWTGSLCRWSWSVPWGRQGLDRLSTQGELADSFYWEAHRGWTGSPCRGASRFLGLEGAQGLDRLSVQGELARFLFFLGLDVHHSLVLQTVSGLCSSQEEEQARRHVNGLLLNRADITRGFTGATLVLDGDPVRI